MTMPRRALAEVRRDGELPLGACADDEPLAAPRDLLGGRERRVPGPGVERLRRALVPLADLPAFDDHVAAIALALDLELSERDQFSLHGRIVSLHIAIAHGPGRRRSRC